MSKAYQIDGRDPSAKGYVKVGREANARELIAINKALKEMDVDTRATAESNAANTTVYVYGRLDDVYGWTVIGFRPKNIFDKGSFTERYLILGDCMDVLEEPYNKFLTLKEVYDYMAAYDVNTANAGCALEAGYDWGLFFHTEPVRDKELNKVWVLTIQIHGQLYPEVHKTFEGAIQSVLNDMDEHSDKYDDVEKGKAKAMAVLREHQYYKSDASYDTIYDIADCPVCD